MEEWKVRQETYHRLNDLDDLLINKSPIVRENPDDRQIINDVVHYFTKPLDALIYPAKSYAVGLIYASLLVKYFGEDFYTVLNDPNLLYDNDPFFVPYKKDKQIYDAVLSHIDLSFTNPTQQVKITIRYFLEEFYISIV